MRNKEIKKLIGSTDWKVGLVPAAISGIAVYILTRVYFKGGVYEIMDDMVANAKKFGNMNDTH